MCIQNINYIFCVINVILINYFISRKEYKEMKSLFVGWIIKRDISKSNSDIKCQRKVTGILISIFITVILKMSFNI